jgi:putative ABC transport system ATP-binding protein
MTVAAGRLAGTGPKAAGRLAGTGPAGSAGRTGVDLVLTGVTRRYGPGGQIRAVTEVNLTVPAGAVVAVRGASGSGKSTLLHLIGGVERADAGQIQVGGVDLTTRSARELARYRQRVGLVFQRFHLLPALSALDNVVAALLARPRVRDRAVRARAALARVGLADRAGAFPAELSGGEQQRVATARAIVGEPVLVLADEPTGNLDSTASREIMELLLSLRDELGTTLLVATHDDQVAAYCDRAIQLHDGRLVS